MDAASREVHVQDRSTAPATDRLAGLLEALRSREAEIVEAAREETDIHPERLASALQLILDSVGSPVVTEAQTRTFREASTRLAREGAPAERVLAGYLSLNWAVWDRIAAMKEASPEAAVELADRLIRGCTSRSERWPMRTRMSRWSSRSPTRTAGARCSKSC